MAAPKRGPADEEEDDDGLMARDTYRAVRGIPHPH